MIFEALFVRDPVSRIQLFLRIITIWWQVVNVVVQFFFVHDIGQSCPLALTTAHPVTLAERPPYSPGLVSSDYWLFPVLKDHLRGERFSCNNPNEDYVEKRLQYCYCKYASDLPSFATNCKRMLSPATAQRTSNCRLSYSTSQFNLDWNNFSLLITVKG